MQVPLQMSGKFLGEAPCPGAVVHCHKQGEKAKRWKIPAELRDGERRNGGRRARAPRHPCPTVEEAAGEKTLWPLMLLCLQEDPFGAIVLPLAHADQGHQWGSPSCAVGAQRHDKGHQTLTSPLPRRQRRLD